MNPEAKKIWVDALRSGRYEQARAFLKLPKGDKWGYCCLGVLCEEAIKAGVKVEAREAEDPHGEVCVVFNGNSTVLPSAVYQWAGLGEPNPMIGGNTASYHNDHAGRDFNEIADLIDEHL